MVIAIFGESCTGKSTIAECLKGELGARVFPAGITCALRKPSRKQGRNSKKCWKTAKNRQSTSLAKSRTSGSCQKLPARSRHSGSCADQRAVCKANGRRSSPPVEKMLKSKHGMFNGEPRDLWIISGEGSAETACEKILAMLRE